MESPDLFLRRRRKVIRILCILMWIGAFTATHIPAHDIPREVLDLGHVVLHSIGFLGLSTWFIAALVAFGVRPSYRVATAVIVMSIYGALDEYTQQFFGRSTRWQDWLTDTLAAIVAVIVWESVLAGWARLARRQALER